MSRRKKIDRKLLNLKKLGTKRLSDTPKIGTPPRTARNILSQNSEIISEISAASESSARHYYNISQKVPSTISSSDILKVSWRVFRVSPLYNFNENKLKIYARKLKEDLAAYNSKHDSAPYDCTFQFQKSLFIQSYDTIQVVLNANNTKYKGYFISLKDNQCKEEFSNIRHFPVLLAHGAEKITKQGLPNKSEILSESFVFVDNALIFTLSSCFFVMIQLLAPAGKYFDCDIHPVRFPFQALTTFFSSLSHMYIDDISDSTSEAVLLYYKIPGCPQSDSIKATLSLAAVSTVFAAFMVQFGNNLSDEQMVSGYYDRIIKHLLSVYQVDLSNAELGKVIFPGFAISSEGWVRFASEEALNRALPMIGKFTGLQYIL